MQNIINNYNNIKVDGLSEEEWSRFIKKSEYSFNNNHFAISTEWDFDKIIEFNKPVLIPNCNINFYSF